MPTGVAQLRIEGLTALQLAELRSAFASIGDESVGALEAPSLSGGRLGEPTALAVVINLAPPVIGAIALWIAKQKLRRTKHIRYTKIDANGSVESFEIDESSYQEGQSSSAAIQTFLEKRLGYDASAAG